MRDGSAWLGASLAIAIVIAPRTAGAQVTDDERAAERFREGTAHLEAGRNEDALRAFEEAHRLSGRAQMLYNMGVALERLERWRDAADQYEQFLATSPNDADRARAEARLLVVRRRAADTGEGTGAHDRDEDAGPSLAPWIALGVGAAAGIAALVTGLVAHGIYGDLTETCTNDVCSPTEEREIDRGRDFATVSTVLTAVAIAGAAAGVVLYFVTGDDGAGGEAASAGPLLAPVAGGAVAGVEGRL